MRRDDSPKKRSLVIVGGGIVGVSTALAARRSGKYGKITIFDANDSLADDRDDDDDDMLSSTDDVSKILRGDYGNDGVYAELFYNRALKAWRELFPEGISHDPLHLNGVLLLSTVDMSDGSKPSFERDCLSYFRENSHKLRVSGGSGRFPTPRVFASSRELDDDPRTSLFSHFKGGYMNSVGGWGESGRILRELLARARRDFDVEIVTNAVIDADFVLQTSKEENETDVILTGGAWTPFLLESVFRQTQSLDRIPNIPVKANTMPVFHFEIPGEHLEAWEKVVTPWTADISRTGFYGFPPIFETQHQGHRRAFVKVGYHGISPNFAVNKFHTRDTLAVDTEIARRREEPKFRDFLKTFVPSLKNARVSKFRLCQYCDSFDGDFLIDRVPLEASHRLFVATGGSGHLFKFGSIIGEMVVKMMGFGGVNSSLFASLNAEKFEHEDERAMETEFFERVKWRVETEASSRRKKKEGMRFVEEASKL